MLLKVSQLLLLLALECTHTLEHLVPVDKSSVKLRTIDANKLCLSSDSESAGTAHTCSVHHDCIQGHFARDVMLLGCQIRELHHDRRTDGKYLIDMLLFKELLHTNGYNTLLAVTSIVSHDDYLVRTLAHLIFKNDKILRPACHNRENPVACSLQSLNNWQHWSYAKTTACTYHSAVFLDFCRIAQRANYVCHVVSLIESTELL